MTRRWLLGSDPETFLTIGDSFVSAHDVIPGTKYEPFFVPHGAIQVDGVAAEFNTFPTNDVSVWVKNHQAVMSAMKPFLMQKDERLAITIQPTAWFDQDYWNSLPDEVKVLGCTPDYNAYTGGENDPPETELPFRTGGGHVHIGWGSGFDPSDPKHFEECRRIVRQLDATLYPASLAWDSDEERRSLYGKVGAFRPKSYGVEYRPLSNKWVGSTETLEQVFNTTMAALRDYDEGIFHSEKGLAA